MAKEADMRTPASIKGHPIHVMLIAFPVGLFVFSLICDLVSLRSAEAQTWALVAFFTMVGGFVGALCAAIPGLVDLLFLWSSANAHIRKTAITHMAINLVIVVLYAINIGLRIDDMTDNRGAPLILSFVAVLALVVSGWLGGMLVHEHGVGVDVVTKD